MIIDRTQKDVERASELAKKGWANMTPEEQAEWIGDIYRPELAGYDGVVNLFPNVDCDTEKCSLKFNDNAMSLVVNQSGKYFDLMVIVGEAKEFENKTLTFYMEGGITTTATFGWTDGISFFAQMDSGNSPGFETTFIANGNEFNMPHFAVEFSFGSGDEVAAGYTERFENAMLEFGSVAHSYVPYVKELPTSARKGAYNYSDLNRVEKAVSKLAPLLGLNLTTKTDWTEWDVPTQADMDRYLENIRLVRTFGRPYTNTPATPNGMSKFTYSSANDIEKILIDINETIESLYRCNDLYCGEV